MKFRYYILVLFICLSQGIQSQSRLSLTPGLFYNGGGFSDDIQGFGLSVGVEYMPHKTHFFGLELRTKYAYYGFDHGTKWKTDRDGNVTPPSNWGNALTYNSFSPQVSLVPRLYLHIDDDIALFLENEFSVGLVTGRFKFKSQSIEKRKISEPIFSYNVGVGMNFNMEKWSFAASVCYSTLNLRSKIVKHQPVGYQGDVPNQDALLLINLCFKIPLKK